MGTDANIVKVQGSVRFLRVAVFFSFPTSVCCDVDTLLPVTLVVTLVATAFRTIQQEKE